jgi:hypothetical protein
LFARGLVVLLWAMVFTKIILMVSGTVGKNRHFYIKII